MISVAGADRLLSMDLHCAQIEGFFNIPVDHLLGVPIITPYFREKYPERENLMIVSPDLGSVTRARNFAARLDVPLAIVDKRRQKANVSEVMNIIGDVKNKDVIIVDDMIDTAGTLCNAAKAIIEIGGAASVSACATHGVLSGPAIERLSASPLKEIVLLDTIPLEPDKKIDKITVLPVAPVISQAIQRIYADTPVSPLFNVY
jgi:ribose-phosphate pyrophosphokinase